jgi:hypothetical protein
MVPLPQRGQSSSGSASAGGAASVAWFSGGTGAGSRARQAAESRRPAGRQSLHVKPDHPGNTNGGTAFGAAAG